MSEFFNVFHSSIPEIMQMLNNADLSAWQMEKLTGMDNSGLQKTLKILAVKGYTERYREKTCIKWKLTEKGRKAAPSIIACYYALEEIS